MGFQGWSTSGLKSPFSRLGFVVIQISISSESNSLLLRRVCASINWASNLTIVPYWPFLYSIDMRGGQMSIDLLK
jgi:hypothetical protein